MLNVGSIILPLEWPFKGQILYRKNNELWNHVAILLIAPFAFSIDLQQVWEYFKKPFSRRQFGCMGGSDDVVANKCGSGPNLSTLNVIA